MVRSLKLLDECGRLPWEDVGHVLVALPNLTNFEVSSEAEDVDDRILDQFSSRTSPRLRKFISFMPIGPSTLSFLNSHPNIKVWRNIFSNAQPCSFDTSPGLRRIERFQASFVNNPVTLAHILRSMTSLTHLTVDHGLIDPDIMRSSTNLRQYLDAFSQCGQNLTSLSMNGTPLGRHDVEPLPWVLSNIVPRTPNLSLLEVRYEPSSLLIDSDPPKVMDMVVMERIPIPSSLRVIILSGIRFFGTVPSQEMSEVASLTASGMTNAKMLFKLFSSLTTYIYVEGDVLHTFGRSEGGECGHIPSLPCQWESNYVDWINSDADLSA